MTLAEKLVRFASVEDAQRECQDREQHTPCPSGYVEWHLWAEEKGKTHRQVRCDGCGRYLIWIPK